MQTNINSYPDSTDQPSAPRDEDFKWQARVLTLVLAEYPREWRDEDLARELLGESPDFDARDSYERAVGDLIRLGVIYRSGSFLSPSRATIHIEELPLS